MTTAILPRLQDLADPDFAVFAMEKAARSTYPDPYPKIDRLRREGAAHHVEYRALFTDVPDAQLGRLDHWTVFGYDACNRVLMDGETFTNREAFIHNLGQSFGNTITEMDGAQHQCFRRVLQKAFLPNVVSRWGGSLVAPVVERPMGRFLAAGRADLVEDYTHRFPFQIDYAMLLLDAEQAPVFRKLAVAQLLSSVGHPQGAEATAKLGDFFQALLDSRRAEPGDDLVSHLATVAADGEQLDDDVLIAFLRQLINAGGDTTYRATSVLLTCLLRDPDQLRAVRDDRSLFGAAIEEALRWDGPVTSTLRYCTRDTEIDGTVIPAGAIVNVCLGSANRDPERYPDPDRFDIFCKRTPGT